MGIPAQRRQEGREEGRDSRGKEEQIGLSAPTGENQNRNIVVSLGQNKSSLGRKSRKACASCGMHSFASSFPASANSTETHWQSV